MIFRRHNNAAAKICDSLKFFFEMAMTNSGNRERIIYFIRQTSLHLSVYLYVRLLPPSAAGD